MFWILVRKDLVRRWRSPASTIVMLLFPFMMAGLIGGVSGGGGSGITEMTVLLEDREDGPLGGFLAGARMPEDADVRLTIVKVQDEGLAMMESGKASALLVIPENFTDDVLSGRPVTLELIRNPAESIKPEIVEQGIEVLAAYLDVAVKTLGPELTRLHDMIETDEMPPVLLVTTLVSEIYQQVDRARIYAFPPVVRMVTEKEEGAPTPNLFGYVLVMVSVMSVLFVAIRAVTDLYEDARTGMLRRQMSAPLSVGMIVASKLAFAVLFGMTVMTVLLVVGAVVGWFEGDLRPGWVLLHTAAFALAGGGLMTVVVALVRNEKQAGILSWIVVMVMSVAGGSMFPAEMMPSGMKALSEFTLNYWAVNGYLDLLVLSEPVSSVLPATALLAVVGVVLTVAGLPLMQRRLREVLR
jgi:ABC-2 type transport system permease protein